MQSKFGKYNVRFGMRWLPLILIFILPFSIIYLTPLSEHISRVITANGSLTGLLLFFLWAVIKPGYIVPPRQLHSTQEKYEHAKKVTKVLRVVLFIVLVWGIWASAIPLLLDSYTYLTTRKEVYTKGIVSYRSTSLYGSYFFQQEIKIDDDNNTPHDYSLTYSLEDRIERGDRIELYALPKTGQILSLQKLTSSAGTCNFETTVTKDNTW